MLFLLIKYLWVFNMSDLSIYQQQCNQQKNHAHFLFKEASLELIAPYALDVVLRKNWLGKLTFLSSDLNL